MDSDSSNATSTLGQFQVDTMIVTRNRGQYIQSGLLSRRGRMPHHAGLHRNGTQLTKHKRQRIFERTNDSLLPRAKFYWRMGKFAFAALVLGLFSLLVGIFGYRYFEQQSWPEAFVNSAMLLSAMGPVSDPQTDGGKIFAGCYALYCGLVFLFTAGLLITPVAHRLLHLFHADPDEEATS